MASLQSTYTTKELQKKLKTQKTLLIIQSIVVVFMIILAVFSSLENGISFQTFLPLFFIPMEVVMFIEIKKELSSRASE
ncbi:hypothetical protein MC378_13850 [Polaribacter sp. MSW13]|uniref:Redox-active disulfide protein 2 n=1 Tax=Polaribacter marinus TaxID=2916838 RepID=A0A9X1VSM0_9FLAO|nr:hypothetical protein [Polaribacter marinus]MCI2230257.1 hypothetical protein [Polaribacter marinus]